HAACYKIQSSFFSSRRRHPRFSRDWSSDVCSSDLHKQKPQHPVRSARSGIRTVERVAMRRACTCGAPFWGLSTLRDRWTGDGRGLTWADYLGKAGPANPPNPQSVQWGERLMSASFAGKVVVV